MINYDRRNGCHNCRYVFEVTDYDTTTADGDLYCTLDAPPRPLCGSIAMEEGPRSPAAREHGYDELAWLEWARARYVHPAGICDGWAAPQPPEIPHCNGGVEVVE